VPSIRLERLTFSFVDAEPILTAADVRIPAGWTALVGENGSGKTTLLRLVAGELAPTGGRVRLEPAAARVVLCSQTVDRPDGAVAALATDGTGPAHRLRGVLGLDAPALARWETLSPGERKRWQIGAALLAEPEVLLLDEPTNHLDPAGRALLVTALRGFRGAGLVVSHDRELLEALARRTLRLHQGELRSYPLGLGEAQRVWEGERRAAWDRRAAAQAEARRVRAQLAEAQREAEGAERAWTRREGLKGNWVENKRGAKVHRLLGAAEDAARAVSDAPALRELGRSVFLGWERAPRPVLLGLDADELRAGPAPLLRDVHVRLRREDRVWLEGANGAGKTTLLAALLQRTTLPPDRILHLPQELPAGAGARLLHEVRELAGEVRGRVLSLVGALGTDPARLLASADPSPGEARKLLLALGMGRHAWALVLDEPTNHLDLPTLERLEQALAAYPGALLLVTHDARLAARCTGSRWHVGEGRVETG
jgi:ATPase subunit of ABC transporter with duplicated ATPase domains